MFAQSPPISVSIVIVVYDDGPEINRTLECLRYMSGPSIEVCIVEAGEALVGALSTHASRCDIQYVSLPGASLAMARNAGIRATRGDLVIFVSSGSALETHWLLDITKVFEVLTVGAVGQAGRTTGVADGPIAFWYPVIDRLGHISIVSDSKDQIFDFPLSFTVPTFGGEFCAFRRKALDDIQGFDERYNSDFASHDICCRLVDAGWLIRHMGHLNLQTDSLAYESETSHIQDRTVFSLLNNRGHSHVELVLGELIKGLPADTWRSDGPSAGSKSDSVDRHDTGKDAIIELRKGLCKAFTRRARGDLNYQAKSSDGFLIYPKYIDDDDERGVFVFVSQQYPPGRLGGIGRNVHELARATASLGHSVHVITASASDDLLSFEDNVWVHRVAPAKTAPEPSFPVPPHIWARAYAVLMEVKKLASKVEVTAVHSPIWDSEGIAVLMDGGFPTVLGLQTPLMFWLGHHATLTQDEAFYGQFAQDLIAIERMQLEGVNAIHANSAVIAKDISEAYDVPFDACRLGIIPHSVEDWTNLPTEVPSDESQDFVRLLFVGRLEWRKGIDVLLDILPSLLDQFPRLYVDIVGDDTIQFDHDKTYRIEFKKTMARHLPRVKFHGEVGEEKLRGFYKTCDIFVAPSRYESFGMILVEAMMFGKAAVGCRAGGMVEIIDEGRTGLLAEPGDRRSLEACLTKLIDDQIYRMSLGKAARKRYEEKFQPKVIARSIVDLMRHARDTWRLSSDKRKAIAEEFQ